MYQATFKGFDLKTKNLVEESIGLSEFHEEVPSRPQKTVEIWDQLVFLLKMYRTNYQN